MSLGGQIDLPIADDATVMAASKITQTIYAAPYQDATQRQQGLAFVAANNIIRALRDMGWRPCPSTLPGEQ